MIDPYERVRLLQIELGVANEQIAILRALCKSLQDLAELEAKSGSRAWTRALDSIKSALRLTA